MTRPLRLLVPLALALALGCMKEKTCTSDLTLCNDRCTPLATDPTNCGACGHSCAAGESCNGGACSCDATACGGASWDGKRSAGTTCDNACVDLASDPANCGACGNVCAGGLVCTTRDDGSTGCASACAGTDQVVCGRACVNLQTHRWNCGACGRACGSKECCVGGRCIADLYLACYASDEVREATGSLAAAGLPIDVAPGPNGLAWAGDRLAVASGRWGGAETLALLDFGAPGFRQTKILTTSAAQPDIEYLAEHDGVLYVSHNSSGTLLLVTPSGQVVDEVSLVPAGATNPNPQGIAFDAGERAYVALEEPGEVLVLDVSHVSSCVSGGQPPPCTTEVGRLDLSPLASPGASPLPTRFAIANGRLFVTLSNLDRSNPYNWIPPPGSTGRIAAIRTDTLTLDAEFAGTANGLIDLGPDCLGASDFAVQGSTLYVTCGAVDYANYPAVTIHGSGIVPVALAGPVAQVGSRVAGTPDQAPGKLAFCGSTGYVADRNSGRVWQFDPASGSTTLGAGVELCPSTSSGFVLVSDIACGR